MKASIFYSWQSDLPTKTNRNFIESAINKALKKINESKYVVGSIDRDTKNEYGSPDITNTVFKKINQCKFFVCDISFVQGSMPNSNVLIELGYAIKSLGWNKILCLFNDRTGKIEDLPFDINHNRITPYNPNNNEEQNKIASIISANVNNLFANGELFNPIEDHLKKKIDYVIFQILRNIANILEFEKTINYSTYFVELDNLSIEELSNKLETSKTLGFYYLYDYDELQEKLEVLLNQMLSSSYFKDSWKESIVNFINWIDEWVHTIDTHFSPNLLKYIDDTNYALKSMREENSQNSPKSVLLLKHLKDDKYKVVQGGSLSNFNIANKLVLINKQYSKQVATRIKDFLTHLDSWMNESGDEIILDPHYFILKE